MSWNDAADVIPEEYANAAIGALLRRRMGPLARQANDQAIVEAAGQATAVLAAVYGLIAADVRHKVLAEVEAALLGQRDSIEAVRSLAGDAPNEDAAS